MHKSTWKKGERKVCRALGGDRSTSPQQTSSSGTNADCVDVPEHVEVKHGNAAERIYEQLMDLHERAKRRDRKPMVVYEALDSEDQVQVKYAAMWFEDYLAWRPNEDTIEDLGAGVRWWLTRLGLMSDLLVEHEVARLGSNQMPCGTLVQETAQRAFEEDRPPLVVLLKSRSPKRVALVPYAYDGGDT